MKKRTIALLLSIVLIFGIAAGGTLAWLNTKSETVTNTFTVGKIGLTLDEAKVDEDGVPIEGADRVMANTYLLYPGSTYTKDPTITVDGDSEACFIYVTVENGIVGLEEGTTIAQQMAANGWVLLPGSTDTWYFSATTGANEDQDMNSDGSVSGGAKLIVFENFTVKRSIGKDLLDYADAEVSITAYAVQAENLSSPDGNVANAVYAWSQTFGG